MSDNNEHNAPATHIDNSAATTTSESAASSTPPIDQSSSSPTHSTTAGSQSSPPTMTNTSIEEVSDAPALPPRESGPGGRTVEERENPQIAPLKAMFPDFDSVILQSVLDSVNGNQDRAVDVLLGMSDPDYVSTAQPEQQQPTMSQTELDEQLARRLMLEEEQAQQAANWRPGPQGGTQYQPYPQIQPGQTTQGGERDMAAEFQDQFNKFAETGKKTFSSIVGKVRAKMQEFDQPRPGQSSSTADTTPNWGSTSSYPSQQQQQQQQQPSYYDPNYEPRRRSVEDSPRRSLETQGYDVTPQSQHEIQLNPGPAAAASSPPATDAPRPPTTSTGAPANIDPAKVGLLPKRPVSLVRDQSAHQQVQRQPSTGSDDLEYVENPFEDGGRK